MLRFSRLEQPVIQCRKQRNTMQAKGVLRWRTEPFAEGSTRWAFQARVKGGEYKGFADGSELVLKVIKTDCWKRGIRLTVRDVAAQRLTLDLCKHFNDERLTRRKVYSCVGMLVEAAADHKDSRGSRYIRAGETMLVENRIRGKYRKFNSNTGWCNALFTLPAFFSHWSWVRTGGKYLVCDLQGHRGAMGGPTLNGRTDYYLFTDPVIMSREAGSYGCSDLGAAGVRKWFQQHKCNALCKRYGLKGNVPMESESCGIAQEGTVYHPTKA